MKLKSQILTLLGVSLLASCSAVYEDLEPCPQGADVRLTFTRNLQGEDLFDAEVHCATLLLYDADGHFLGQYPYTEGSTLKLDLPTGRYHAIAYGGMLCDDADFDFAEALADGHHYADVQTFIKGTRDVSLAKDLHQHFHGVGDFEITDEDMEHISHVIDLTRNINNFHVVLSYADGSTIKADDYRFSITADNAVTDHANNIVKQGEPVVYMPHSFDTTRAGEEGASIKANITTGKLETDSEATLKVTTKDGSTTAVNIDLMEYLAKISADDMPGASLQDYLDCQNDWTLEFTLEPESDKIAGLTFKINDWIVVINNFNL